MARSTKDAVKFTNRRKTVAELYLEGWRQNELAAHLKVNQSTISRDLKAIRKQWMESALIDFNEAKARELTKIDNLETEYWDAWRRSMADAEIKTQKVKGKMTQQNGENGFVQERPAEVIKVNKGQAGDPRFLNGVEWCIEQRCKIMGVYEATKLRIDDWRSDVIAQLRDGRIAPDEVRLAWPELADEFFREAGVNASAN